MQKEAKPEITKLQRSIVAVSVEMFLRKPKSTSVAAHPSLMELKFLLRPTKDRLKHYETFNKCSNADVNMLSEQHFVRLSQLDGISPT